MRAMRSVRSIARISSWAQLRGAPNLEDADKKDKDQPEAKKKKKKKDKEKEKERVKETIRYSGSSFEAGSLTASPEMPKTGSKSLGKKKTSILGLGLPSTIRLPSSRSGSTASSVVVANNFGKRPSVDSATVLGGGILARGRSASQKSTTSSLRPNSVASCVSGGSSNSGSSASVRWDEAGLETVKENRRMERESKNAAKKEKEKSKKKSKGEKDSARKLSDSRKRKPLTAIFPGTLSEREEEGDAPPLTPIVTIEEATMEGCSGDEDISPTETPGKRPRSRPMSEHLLGRSRPKAIYDDGDGEYPYIISMHLVLSCIDRQRRHVIVGRCDKRSGATHQ